MKTVFSNDECAHVWAQQLPGQYGRGYSVQFDGPAIYSWGRHYLTGFIMPDGTALLNSTRYSPSTGKHMNRAAGATRHRTQVYVPNLTAWQDTLETAARVAGNKGKLDSKFRATLRDRVANEALTLSDAAGAYLMGLAGYPAATWARVRESAMRKAEQANARNVRNMLDHDRTAARKFGDMSGRDFASEVQRARAYGNEYAPDSALRDLAAELYRAHRYGAAGTSKADKARRPILWARLGAVRAAAARAGANTKRASEVRDAMRAIATIRAAINPAVQPHNLWQSGRWSALADAITKLTRNARVSMSTHAKLYELRALATVADTECQRIARAAEYAAALEVRTAWLAGESVRLPYGATDETGGALIRAVDVERDESGAISGGTLETSQSVRVPLCHALRAFRFLKLCHDTGRTWEANGRTIRVGHYRIDRVDGSGDFVAGCHRINWGEVSRLALELGVFALPASEDALEPSAAAA